MIFQVSSGIGGGGFRLQVSLVALADEMVCLRTERWFFVNAERRAIE